MANPTSNFGWQMPTPVDLVTDLPADFEVFGQAVDSSLADLKGGTSGQVLSKNSNTDMDFVWVTSDDANAIQNTIVDAKGDLISATGSDTPARLAVGNNGETLIADSSTSTGLRYQAPYAQQPVLNSAFQIWQRGTSTGGNGVYTADRWYAGSSAAGRTVSRQVTGDTTNLPNVQYCLRFQRDSGNTNVSASKIIQNFETIDSIPYAGQAVTLSFYARKGANYSAVNDRLNAYLVSGTGTDQNQDSGFTGQAIPINGTATTLTTTWQRFSYTGTVATTATQLAIRFDYTPVGTAGAADYFEVTGVQLELGSVATPFHTYAATIQGELAACQRYFQRFGDGVANEMIGLGTVASNNAYILIPHPVQLRSTPSLSVAGNANFIISNGVASNNPTAINADILSSKVSSVGVSFGVVVTAGTAARWYRDASDPAYVDFSAEL
jgi:hypothetical protein